MASSSSASNPLLGVQITEKLAKTKQALWKVQVLTAICSMHMEGHVTGKVIAPVVEKNKKKADNTVVAMSNPAYEWYARDQQVLGMIFSSLGKDVLAQIDAAKTAM